MYTDDTAKTIESGEVGDASVWASKETARRKDSFSDLTVNFAEDYIVAGKAASALFRTTMAAQFRLLNINLQSANKVDFDESVDPIQTQFNMISFPYLLIFCFFFS